MADLVVDRSVPPARFGSWAPPSHWVGLVAVAVGLLFGALACAAGLGGGAHSAALPSILESDELPTAHDGPLAPMAESGSHSTVLGDHGDHSRSPSMAGGHPGMACVVLVDLQFPEASCVPVSASHQTQPAAMSTDRPADVDPPVPRFS